MNKWQVDKRLQCFKYEYVFPTQCPAERCSTGHACAPGEVRVCERLRKLNAGTGKGAAWVGTEIGRTDGRLLGRWSQSNP